MNGRAQGACKGDCKYRGVFCARLPDENQTVRGVGTLLLGHCFDFDNVRQGQLLVAPCILPNFSAGPYWVRRR